MRAHSASTKHGRLIIFDANVLSECLRPAPDARVMAWIVAQPSGSLFTITMVEAEVLDELVPRGGSPRDFVARDDEGGVKDARDNLGNASLLEGQSPTGQSSAEGAMPIGSYKDLIIYVADRPGRDQRYAIDASKIQRDLGWVPQETFETGLRKTVEWYLNNPGWCQHVQDGSYQRQRLGVIEGKQGAVA